MRSLTLLTVVVIILLSGCYKNPQKQPAKYTDFEWGSYYYASKKDSSFLMYSRYVNNPDDTLKKAMAYRYMGDIQWGMGDHHGAQESATGVLKTLDTLEPKHHTELGYAYNLLGNASLDMKRYDEAIDMYDKAIRFLSGSNFMLEVMNGKATAYQKKGAYQNAIAVYDSILTLKPVSQALVARIIDNRARTKWLQDPSYPVLPEFWHALKIRTDSQYHTGLNASYAHLSEYYEANSADSALSYANLMYHKAQKPEDRLEAMDKLIRLHNTADIKQRWYAAHKTLSDSFQLAKDTTRSRFAMIRYDFQKSRADNLVLQQHISKQRLWIYGVAILAIAFMVSLWAWYTKRRRKIKQDAENAIRDSKLKTSQKVHDVVANSLYRIMNELEHTNSIDREALLDNIETLYERSRDISYEEVTSGESRNSRINDLLSSFANAQTDVFVIGSGQSFWSKVTDLQKQELELVLNEIMVNMKKHSRAKNVVIGFKLENNKACIMYKDDGIGFPAGLEFGNGLKNTVSRIKSLSGDISFGQNGDAGVTVTISLPLQSDNA